MMKTILSKSLLLLSVILTTSVYADKFEQLSAKTQLSKDCEQDSEDVFKPQAFILNTGKVILKTYSCQTKKNNQDQYYSTYGLQFSPQKSLYLQDKLFDAIGYVGIKAEKVDVDTVVFDNMSERGGDLILVWVQDLNHVYQLKIPYMASEVGGVKLTAKNDLIFIQKIEIFKVIKDKPIFRNVGKPISFKKVKDKGLAFYSGDLKTFINEVN